MRYSGTVSIDIALPDDGLEFDDEAALTRYVQEVVHLHDSTMSVGGVDPSNLEEMTATQYHVRLRSVVTLDYGFTVDNIHEESVGDAFERWGNFGCLADVVNAAGISLTDYNGADTNSIEVVSVEPVS